MVRQKARWLLVRLDFESDVTSEESRKRKRGETVSMETIVIFRAIRESLSSSFGVAANGVIQDIQGTMQNVIFGPKTFRNKLTLTLFDQFGITMNKNDWL